MNNKFKVSLTAALVSTAMFANAGISIVDNENGNFSIGGDVEFDFNYEKLGGENGNKDYNFNQNGRILLEFQGERFTSNGNVLQVNVQPLMESSGDVNLDDAWFAFGAQDGWNLRMGRFEAFDMFPVGQDTFLEYSGNTSNELYSDAAPYVYQMKEGRGRGATGQIMYSQQFNQLYFELAALIGPRDKFFEDGVNGTYHGAPISSDVKDSAIVRPVLAYGYERSGFDTVPSQGFNFAVSLETNLVKDAVVTKDGGVDISDRTGYGATMGYTMNDWNVLANFAYMDAVDETNMTIGANLLYKGFGLGYIYADNDYENKKIGTSPVGNATVDTVYASYEFKDVLNVDDFLIYLGAYHSNVNDKTVNNSFSELDSDTGFRVRFKYYF